LIENIFEAIDSVNGYVLLGCVTYSLISGFFIPELANLIYPKRNEPPGIAGFKWALSIPLALLISGMPGGFLAWTVNQNYGRLSFLAILIAFAVRRVLNMIGIARDPRNLL
jgi:hypothetical protein